METIDEMKCEICNERDAQEAINVDQDGEQRELYVCNECARRERVGRKKKSQRTRKERPERSDSAGPGRDVVADGVPPEIASFADMLDSFINDIKNACQPSSDQKSPDMQLPPPKGRKRRDPYRIRGRLHLEALHLIGEMEAVHRAMRALDMVLEGIDADGICNTGHAYVIKFSGGFQSEESARRVEQSILEQERNARVRLVEEMPRVFADSVCRALAVLKNCMLLSPSELFDLLSPLRLAAEESMLDGITLKEIDNLMEDADLSSSEDNMSLQERDQADAARADRINKLFEEVVVNEKAEGRFL